MASKKAAARHGLLLIDKPGGWTSHDVVARVRRLAGQRQVGHTGTLDPMATGLMAVLLGSATRLEPWLTKMDKVYRGQMELGLATDTDDVTGRELSRRGGPWPTEEVVRRALKNREGEGDQIPPAFSAIQVDGQRAHKAARAGRPLRLEARRVTAYRLEPLDWRPPLLDFRAEVSSGYYIRSLARDVGEEFFLGGALSALRRERVGPWSLEAAVTLEELAAWTEEDWRDKLKTPAEALPHWPGLTLDGDQARRFILGQKLPVEEPTAPGRYKILNPAGLLLGLAETEYKPSLGGTEPRRPFLRPLRVFPVE